MRIINYIGQIFKALSLSPAVILLAFLTAVSQADPGIHNNLNPESLRKGFAAQEARLTGEVRDPQRNPIAGARVSVTAGDREQVVETDSEGRFAARVAPGLCRIRVSAQGFAVHETSSNVEAAGSELLIMLEVEPLRLEVLITAGLPDLASTQEYNREQIEERPAGDIGDFLRRQPGLSAFRRGSINFDPSVRGMRETQVATLVDGTRTFAAGPGRMDAEISHISPHSIQTLQVVKGPYALTWGAGALTAIRAETFRPPYAADRFEIHARAGFNYGSNGNSRDGYGSIWMGNDKLRFSLSHNTRLGNDYKAGNGEVIPGDYLSNDSRWSFGFRPGKTSNFEYVGGFQQQEDIDYPGQMLDASYFITRSHAWEYRWQPLGSGITEVFGQLYLNHKDHLMNNDNKPTALPMPGRMPPFALRIDYPTSSDSWGGRYHVAGERRAWQWKAGGDFYYLNQNARRYIYRRDTDVPQSFDIVWPDARINDQGLYGQLIYQGERAQIGGTVRMDFVQSSAGEVSSFFAQNTSGDLDQRENNLSAALHARYRLRDGWVLSSGVGRSVRTAMAIERYSDRFPSSRFQLNAEFMGNPGIRPEKSTQIDLGSEWNFLGLTLQAEVFYRRIDDYITVIADPSLPRKSGMSSITVYRYVNGPEATFYGGEVQVSRQLGPYLGARGRLDYLWGEDQFFNEPVIGIQPLRGTIEIEAHTPDRRFFSIVSATIVDRQTRVAAQRFELPTPGYTVFDWRNGWRISDHINFNIGLENIGDRYYINHLNNLRAFTRLRLPEPGRNFYAGLEFSF